MHALAVSQLTCLQSYATMLMLNTAVYLLPESAFIEA